VKLVICFTKVAARVSAYYNIQWIFHFSSLIASSLQLFGFQRYFQHIVHLVIRLIQSPTPPKKKEHYKKRLKTNKTNCQDNNGVSKPNVLATPPGHL